MFGLKKTPNSVELDVGKQGNVQRFDRLAVEGEISGTLGGGSVGSHGTSEWNIIKSLVDHANDKTQTVKSPLKYVECLNECLKDSHRIVIQGVGGNEPLNHLLVTIDTNKNGDID